jgi:hypothetical protein
VAGIFLVAVYAVRTFVGSSRRGFCVGVLRVFPAVDAGRELLCEVWLFRFTIFLIGIRLLLSRGESLQLGYLLSFSQVRSCVL